MRRAECHARGRPSLVARLARVLTQMIFLDQCSLQPCRDQFLWPVEDRSQTNLHGTSISRGTPGTLSIGSSSRGVSLVPSTFLVSLRRFHNSASLLVPSHMPFTYDPRTRIRHPSSAFQFDAAHDKFRSEPVKVFRLSDADPARGTGNPLPWADPRRSLRAGTVQGRSFAWLSAFFWSAPRTPGGNTAPFAMWNSGLSLDATRPAFYVWRS